MDGAVKPWEWGEAPVFWIEATLMAMNAEHKAKEHLNKKAERKAGRSRSKRR